MDISYSDLVCIAILGVVIWYQVMDANNKLDKVKDTLGYMRKDIDKLTEKIEDLEKKLKK